MKAQIVIVCNCENDMFEWLKLDNTNRSISILEAKCLKCGQKLIITTEDIK